MFEKWKARKEHRRRKETIVSYFKAMIVNGVLLGTNTRVKALKNNLFTLVFTDLTTDSGTSEEIILEKDGASVCVFQKYSFSHKYEFQDGVWFEYLESYLKEFLK